MDPLIISCALTGGLATPEDNPHLPFNPDQLGHAAVDAWREGASIVHLHGRAEDGSPTGDLDCFRRAAEIIRGAGSDVIINITTSYGGDIENVTEQRMRPLELRPEIASFDCGSMNFNDDVFENSVEFLRELAAGMQAAGVKPELEIFDAGMIGTVERLVAEGLIDDPLFFQFVLGIRGGAPATLRELMHLRDLLPPSQPWSVCALGRQQLPLNAHAIALGGHARTGLEDNLWFRRGEHASNGQLVARVRRLAEMMERPVATPDQAREILGLAAPRGSHL